MIKAIIIDDEKKSRDALMGLLDRYCPDVFVLMQADGCKDGIEKVKNYCIERSNSVDAEKFIDHYTSNGWKVGGKAPMKNWEAAVRNWEKSDTPAQKAQHAMVFHQSEKQVENF